MKTSGGIDVLLVEDNHDHARFILKALEEDGSMATHWASDGQAALEFLRARYAETGEAGSARPLVVLLDVHLPKISGLEVLRQIRGEEGFPAIPVVMLTTSDQREGISAAYRAGANSYVTKPVKFGDFVQKMESLKRYWTFTSEIPAA